jgi:hypothetical protein
MASRSLLIAQGWLLQPSHLPLVDTRTKSAGTPTFLILVFEKEKAALAAFSFSKTGIKKVGVPADLVLVSTKGRCEGWRSHPRAIRSDLEAILVSFRFGRCDCDHKSMPTKGLGHKKMPQ